MKLNRLIAVSIVGFSMLSASTSAFACDHDHDSGGSSWSWFGCCHHDNGHDGASDKGGSGRNCPGQGGAGVAQLVAGAPPVAEVPREANHQVADSEFDPSSSYRNARQKPTILKNDP